MKINQEKAAEMLQEYFAGNCSRFAKEIGVDTSQLHRYLSKGVGGGKKMIGGIIKFCKENQLDYEKYIEI